jgi:hypothetical protein
MRRFTLSSYRSIQRSIALVLVTLLAVSGSIPAQSGPSSDQQLGILAGKLDSRITIRSSWSVLEGFVDAELDTDKRSGTERDALRLLNGLLGFSDFRDPSQAFQFLAMLRRRSISYSTQALVDTGVPRPIAQEISERMARKHLFQIQQALLTFSRVPKNITPKTFGAAIAGASRQSTKALLVRSDMKPSDFDSITKLIRAGAPGNSERTSLDSDAKYAEVSEQIKEPTAREDLQQRFALATTQPKLMAIQTQLLAYVNKDAISAYNSLENTAKEHFLDALAEDFVARASNIPVPTVGANLTINRSVEVLKSVGEFQALERRTAEAVSSGATNITRGLTGAHDLLNETWDDQIEAARQITRSVTSLPPAAAQIAGTAHFINDLQTVISGGDLSSGMVSELGGMVSANVPHAGEVFQLVTGINQITNSQASFAERGKALLGTLAAITKSPAIEQVQSVFNSLAPIIQTAGPLLAVASFASPLGGISMIGGLLGGGGGLLGGGGGGGDEAALQAINQKLEEINHKLDVVINKLDQLDEKLTRQHIQVMNALESISFDINRTRDLILSNDVKAFSTYCESLQTTSDESDFVACNSKLRELNAGASSKFEPHAFLKALPNFSTENLGNTAYDKLQKLEKVYSKTSATAQGSCFSLVLAAYSLHDITKIGNVGRKAAANDVQANLCSQVLSFSGMLHSGTLTFFSALEWDAADRSKDLKQERANQLIWNPRARESNKLLQRWTNELRLLNIAIGQQARLTGDFTVPQWAAKLDLDTPLDKTDQEVLDQSEILADNSIRYWLDSHVRDTEMLEAHAPDEPGFAISRTLRYAYAYHACSPIYLESLTEFGSQQKKTDFQKIHFNWTNELDQISNNLTSVSARPATYPCVLRTGSAHRWCALFDGLNNCIDLPTPTEMITGEFRRSDNLEALLDARDNILTLIETTQLIDNLKPTERQLLLEAIAMKWSSDQKNRPDQETPKSNIQETRARPYRPD